MTTPDAATWARWIDSCHCTGTYLPDPGPCDGWLQHRKCDALASALATLHAQAVAAAELSAMEIARHAAKRADEAEQRLAQAVQAEREACASQAWACSESHGGDTLTPRRKCCGPLIADVLRARGPQDA